MTVHSQHVLIGLTGPILSGKSTVLAFFKKAGAGVLSADALAHQALQSPLGKQAVLNAFGTVERRELAAHVFACSKARKKLEGILHPLVWQLAQEEIKKSRKKIIVFEVPLLFEAEWDGRMNLNLFICPQERTLQARLLARGMPRKEYEKRLHTQWSIAKKAARADVVIQNAGSITQLGEEVSRLYDALRTIYG